MDYLVDGYEIFFIPDEELNDKQRELKHQPDSWMNYCKLAMQAHQQESQK